MEPWPPWQTLTLHLKIPRTRAYRVTVRYSILWGVCSPLFSSRKYSGESPERN